MIKYFMRNIRLLVQYDGTNYNGWQIQNTEDKRQKIKNRLLKKIITVQGTIQSAIKKITGEEVKVIGASRTDAGVHALGQVASFRTACRLSTQVIKRALNATLPDDIRILDCDETDINFHPRYDAKSKSYFYIICLSDVVSPFVYRYVWKVNYRLDINAMSEGLKPLIGCYDFSAFRASGCGAKNTMRTIYNISLEKMENIYFMSAKITGDFLKIRIEANAFLRHMVRNIVGTIVKAGKNGLRNEDIEEILRSKDRKKAGQTAPAHGLFLERIIY
jgi:tRNA pseudouridine38-40 synthase